MLNDLFDFLFACLIMAVFLGVIGLVMLLWEWLTSDDSGSSVAWPPAAAQRRQLDEVSDFTQAAARVQTNTARSVHHHVTSLGNDYAARVQRLDARGELTPAVDAEFQGLAETSMRGWVGLTGELGSSLNELIENYGPTGSGRSPSLSGRPGNHSALPSAREVFQSNRQQSTIPQTSVV